MLIFFLLCYSSNAPFFLLLCHCNLRLYSVSIEATTNLNTNQVTCTVLKQLGQLRVELPSWAAAIYSRELKAHTDQNQALDYTELASNNRDSYYASPDVYYASVMLVCFQHQLWSKLCQHNRKTPIHSHMVMTHEFSVVILQLMFTHMQQKVGTGGGGQLCVCGTCLFPSTPHERASLTRPIPCFLQNAARQPFVQLQTVNKSQALNACLQADGHMTYK